MKKLSELVFIPLPAIGHLPSALQLAKLLVTRDEHLSIRILLIIKDASVESCITSFVYPENVSRGRIQFTEVPEPQANNGGSSGEQPDDEEELDFFFFLFKLMESRKTQVRDLVSGLIESSSSTKIVGFVVDMLSSNMVDVANEFGLPTYCYYTSAAASIGLWSRLQSLENEDGVDITKYRDSDIEISVLTYANPVPAKLFPSASFYKQSLALCLKITDKMMETKGIIVNTFPDLESYALNSLARENKMPRVYPIGPLINFDGINVTDHQDQETNAVMEWLDDQPDSSVVFLCFGSGGFFDGKQLKEIANALEQSGYKFLWSLRRPPSLKDYGMDETDSEFHDQILPEGFLQRTCGIGKVIGWAPQIKVLGHPAIGGFVTHCGWNSILESIWFGVPMAVWPLYAEQQSNAFLLAKCLGMAVEIKVDYTVDPFSSNYEIVRADEIAKGIRKLMQLPAGSETRKKVKGLMQKCRNAIADDGGSSYICLESFLNDLHGHVH